MSSILISPMHPFHELLHKEPKSDAERAAVTGVMLLSVQAKFDKLTPEEIYDTLLREANQTFNMGKTDSAAG